MLLLLLLSHFSRSFSVWPHRRQPTRLPRPWDSPGKNPGVGCHFLLQCMKVKSESEVAQSCLTLCDPMDCRPPGSSLHGVFQARVLEWDAIAFSNLHFTVAQKYIYLMKVKVKSLSHVWLFVTPWTVCSPSDSSVHGILQARIWSGLPIPSPGDLPGPGIELASPKLAGRFFTTELPGKAWLGI